jgi:uncharacterized protein
MTQNTTDKHNPLVSVQEFPDDGKLQIIHGYGNGQFRIAGQSYHGAQFIFPRLTLGWQINSLADIRGEQIAKCWNRAGMPALLKHSTARRQSW